MTVAEAYLIYTGQGMHDNRLLREEAEGVVVNYVLPTCSLIVFRAILHSARSREQQLCLIVFGMLT